MFRVESQIELLRGTGRYPESPAITLRGYREEDPIVAPAQFKDTPPVSVGTVVGFCPSLRDLYLRKRLKLPIAGEKEQNLAWRRVAGRLIEGALENAYDYYSGKASPCGKSIEQIAKAAVERVTEYARRKKKAFGGLDARRKGRLDLSNQDFQHVLTDSVVLDLFFHQGALNYGRLPASNSSHLDSLKLFPEWEPAPYLKLGKAAPDFTVPKHNAIGDVKSGDWSDDYLITAAGYALAYESTYKSNVNLGVIYLVETDPMFLTHGRLRMFALTDPIRQRFLDRRNDALRVLMPKGPEPQMLTGAETIARYCEACACKPECFARGSGPGARSNAPRAH